MTSAFTRITAVSGLLAALCVPAVRTAGADVEPYLAEYQASNAALQAGDIPTAATHGLAAWKAAEQALGAHRLTGILAFNYGRLIVFSAPEQAAWPLRRASRLQEAGVTELPEQELRLYLRYAEFAESGFEEGPADDLRDALNAVGLENEALIGEVAPMWLKLAAEDLANKEYRKAVKSAATAEAAIAKANTDSSHELVEAILLGGVARLGIRPRTIEVMEAANEQFDRASHLFPPQEDIDSFDPLFAQVLAWHHAAWFALKDLYKSKGRKPPDSDDDESETSLHFFRYAADEAVECGEFEWERRTMPNYPGGALHDGYLGAAVIGYRLGDDLNVHDARILAEVPSGQRFGKVSLRAVSDWRLKSLPDGDPACYRNVLAFIRFVMWNRGRTD